MPTIHRIAFTVALAAIATGALILIFSPALAGLLALSYTLLWFVWIASVFAPPAAGYLRRVLTLWALFDLGLLLAILGMAAHYQAIYSHLGPDGSDLIIGSSYAPVTIPTALAVAYFAPSLLSSWLTAVLERTLGHVYASFLDAWVIMSCIAAFQSLVLVTLVGTVRKLRGQHLNLWASNNRSRVP